MLGAGSGWNSKQSLHSSGSLWGDCRLLLHHAEGVTSLCQQDSFQEHYAQTGRFPGPVVTPPRRPWALINWLFWACLLLYPLCLLLVRLIQSGSVATILGTVALCIAGWFQPLRPGWVSESFSTFNQIFFFFYPIVLLSSRYDHSNVSAYFPCYAW